MNAHALLAPSAASRWIACPPSARLEEENGRGSNFQATSEAADEGTLAHKLAEKMLEWMSHKITKKAFDKALKEIKANKLYAPAMYEHVENFAVFVMERFAEAQVKTPDAKLYLEVKVDLSAFAPESFGTIDVCIAANHTLEIIDLKYGKGVPVYAKENAQLMLYALGAGNVFGLMYDFQEVVMIIYQPRLDNITKYELPISELAAWGIDTLMPAAKLAFKGEGEFNAGSHCRFCSMKATCRAHAAYNLERVKDSFPEPVLLDNSEIADTLDRVDSIRKWLDSIESYALHQAVNNGTVFPGYKIVEGKSSRRFTDEDRVRASLMMAGFKSEQFNKPPALIGITDMEKLTGKAQFTGILGAFVTKPKGSPTLVPVGDKRPEFNNLEGTLKAFENIE